MDDDSEHKKAKGTKKWKCVIKQRLKFNDYKDCLFKNEIIQKSQRRFKSKAHNVYAEKINKITLRSNDDKRLQTFNRITTYTYGTNNFKVCGSEMLSKYKELILMIIQMKIKQSIIKSGYIYSRSPIQNIDNRRFSIWKNKCIIELNKQPATISPINY